MMKSSEQIQLALSKCKRNSCSKECPYHGEGACYVKMLLEAGILIRQLERERDAAVEALLLLAETDCVIPCESDELACSEYCENHCSFRTAQKECWMEYLRRRGVQEVE